MKLLITGICGFVGSVLARGFAESGSGLELHGVDNFVRPGSETNRAELKRLGVRLAHADLRSAADLEALPACEWVVDAAANPSVTAGVDGRWSSRQLVEHNLGGTLNLLEYAKRHRAGVVLLSTSRVYSIAELRSLPLVEGPEAFRLEASRTAAGPAGVSEEFSTRSPLSLYGATKLASEAMALEYGEAFGLPVFVNRCGVMAGAGQFGRADQGIHAYWIHSWLRRRPLKYLGFGGRGLQVRDGLHPMDLVPLLQEQFSGPRLSPADRVVNLSGGADSARSLRQIGDWCAERFGTHGVSSDPAERPFDVPWLVLDSSKAARIWGWRARTGIEAIWEDIARHAEAHPDWLDLSAPI
ncbi:MAG: NAD-dependent epimerase/dehydratase family protein [Opitutaceae bacterium]